MAKNPEVSIIVPVYNVEKYIRQCLDSITNQKNVDYEVIAVDDGSPDSCGEILDRYSESNDRIVVVHQENAGVSAARNKGIEQAKGKWVYFVDSDDWLIDDSLETAVNVADKTDVDILFLDCLEQYDNGKEKRLKLFSQNFITDKKEGISRIQKSVLCHKYSPYFSAGADNAYPAPWSKLIRTQLIKDNNIRFKPQVKGVYDDGLFTVEILEYAKKVAYKGNCVYNYRILNSSIVHSFKKDMISRFELNCFEMDDLISKYRKDSDFIQAEYCRRVAYFSSFMSAYYYNESYPYDNKRRKQELKTAITNKPWKEAIEGASIKNLENKHKYTLLCLRFRFYFGLRLYSKLKKIVKGS